MKTFLAILLSVFNASALVTVSGTYPVSPVTIDTGNWNGFVGTPVSPNQFLTSGHVGGSVGDTFTVNGMSYTATEVVATTYLALWTVDRSFTHWAALDLTPRNAMNPMPVFMTGGGGTTGWNEARFTPFFAWTTYDRNIGTYLGQFEAQAVSGDSGGGLWTFNDRNPELSGIIHAEAWGTRTYAITLRGHEEWLQSNLTPVAVPEPATSALLLLAVGIGFVGYNYIRK